MAETIVEPTETGTGDEFVTANWLDEYEDFDDDAKKALSKYESREQALLGAVEAQKMLGSGFRLPETLGEKETKELLKRAAKVQGVPEKAEDYQVTDPPDEVLPMGMTIDKDAQTEFKILAKEHNLSPQTVQACYDFQKQLMRNMVATQQEELANRQEKVYEKLKELWDGDKAVATKLELLQRHLRKYAETEDEWDNFKNRIFANGKGDELILLRALGPWAEAKEAEGGSPPGQGPGAKGSDFQKRLAQAKELYPNSPELWPKQ